MLVDVQEDLYSALARRLALKVATTIVSGLISREVFTKDVICAREAAVEDLVFDLAFFALAQFEDTSGLEIEGVRYLPHCLFAPAHSAPSTYIAGTSRTALHGALDDDLLEKAFGTACSNASKP